MVVFFYPLHFLSRYLRMKNVTDYKIKLVHELCSMFSLISIRMVRSLLFSYHLISSFWHSYSICYIHYHNWAKLTAFFVNIIQIKVSKVLKLHCVASFRYWTFVFRRHWGITGIGVYRCIFVLQLRFWLELSWNFEGYNERTKRDWYTNWDCMKNT